MSSPLDAAQINAAIDSWRQGDVVLGASIDFLHMADLTCPLSPAAKAAAEDLSSTGNSIPEGPQPLTDPAMEGFVVLTQTCDLIRSCLDRPFAEVSPLVRAPSDKFFEEVRKNKRPNYAFVAGVGSMQLIADLDRVMTIEKSLIAKWKRVPGCRTDADVRDFSRALRRSASRFAFPDDFERVARKFQERILNKHDKQSTEGAHLQSLREIRVRASPSWDATEVQLLCWLIKETDPPDADWAHWSQTWASLFDGSGRFTLDPPIVVRLEDITALDYVESDRLDLDRLSGGQNAGEPPQ